MKIYTKESLIAELRKICARGWIRSARQGNVGGVGNTLEDLLGIKENNLPIPNAAEWELKCQRLSTKSYITLFHMEPSPTSLKLVPNMLLPKYGWTHKTIAGEKSFRQTITGSLRSDRGFMVAVDRTDRMVRVSFDSAAVAERHAAWLAAVKRSAGPGELDPQPYWGFDNLASKAGTKLLNCFFVQARTKQEAGKEWFSYERILMLQKFSFDKFLTAIERGHVLVDFDARSGHNHGTKFRIRQAHFPDLYESAETIAIAPASTGRKAA